MNGHDEVVDHPVPPGFCYQCGDILDRAYHRYAGPGDHCDRRAVPDTVDDWARGVVGGALLSLGTVFTPGPRFLPDACAAAIVRQVLRGRHDGAGALVDDLVDVLVRLPGQH